MHRYKIIIFLPNTEMSIEHSDAISYIVDKGGILVITLEDYKVIGYKTFDRFEVKMVEGPAINK